MAKNKQSVDGFVRRDNSSLRKSAIDDSIFNDNHTTTRAVKTARKKSEFTIPEKPASRADEDQLKDIKLDDKKTKKKSSRKKKIIKRTIIILLLILAIVGIFVLVKTIIASGKVFDGNPFGLIQKKDLKMDKNGRSNMLVFGTAEDDEGGTHDGGNLTDSLMLLSVDQKKKEAFMLSLPRDLWVDYGTPCSSGYQGKINAVYSCGSEDGKHEKDGAKALMKKIGEVTGLEMHYYIHLNFTAFVEAVDAVGGVEVKIETEDPRGILDRNFDWKCNYKCHFVNYKQGETVKLDGEHALALARARNASGGYGLPGGNFDREKNQQKIMLALQEKALSIGTLTNVGKVTGLIDALGNNVRTNFSTSEIRTLMGLGTDIPKDKIKQLTLVDKDNPLVTTDDAYGQSIVRPTAGLLDYSGIRSYIQKNASKDPVTRESAEVAVFNASGVEGAAQTEADSLAAKGFLIGSIDNAGIIQQEKVQIYQIGEGSRATAKKLKAIYGVEPLKTDPPILVADSTRFVVIVGVK